MELDQDLLEDEETIAKRQQEAAARADAMMEALLKEESEAKNKKKAQAAEKEEARRAALAAAAAAAPAADESESEESSEEDEDEDEDGMLSMLASQSAARKAASSSSGSSKNKSAADEPAAKAKAKQQAAEDWHRLVKQEVHEHLIKLQEVSPVADIVADEIAPLGTQGHVKVALHCRQQVVGSIIGQGGQQIRDLRALNYAKLEVHNAPSDPNAKRMLEISGDCGGVCNLLDELKTLLEADTEAAERVAKEAGGGEGGGGGQGGRGHPRRVTRCRRPPTSHHHPATTSSRRGTAAAGTPAAAANASSDRHRPTKRHGLTAAALLSAKGPLPANPPRRPPTAALTRGRRAGDFSHRSTSWPPLSPQPTTRGAYQQSAVAAAAASPTQSSALAPLGEPPADGRFIRLSPLRRRAHHPIATSHNFHDAGPPSTTAPTTTSTDRR